MLSNFGQRSKLIRSGSIFLSPSLNSAQTSTAVGDVNADGLDDILLNQLSPSTPSYLYLGGYDKTSLTSSIPIQGLPNRQTIYQYGQAGDINGDGHDDLLIADFDKNLTYAVYGQDWLSQAATWNSGVTVQVMEGTNANDVFQSYPQGNFLLNINGQNGNDYVNTPILPSSQVQSFLFKGGEGDDQFGLPATDSTYITHIDGGSGYDTLFLEQTTGSLNSLDLTKLGHKVSNIEEIDLGYANSVIFDAASLLKVLDSNKTLILNGVQSLAKPSDPTSSNWSRIGEDSYDGDIYEIYSYANTALEVWIQKGGVSWSPLPNPYKLQLLHFSDGEAGLLASQTAPYLAALVDGFDGTLANTLILAGGDNFIPSPFLNGGTDQSVRDELNAVTGSTIDLSSSVNHPIAAVDIAIHNVIGVEASTLGNHEFDLGPRVLRDAFTPNSVSGWVGAQFPYLSANLDFSGDADLNPRFTNTTASAGLEDAISVKGRIVPSAVVTKNGEKIGLVGATTQVLEQISSTGRVEVKGFSGDGGERDDMVLLASHLQPVIDDLTAQGVNKVILMAHLQHLANEKALAPLLRGVDIILAAGSNTRLGDSNDLAMAFPGHDANFADSYPIVSQGADGAPTLIVNTDNEYTYLGRLVVDFDERGRIIPTSVDPLISGAYAATAANVAKAWNVSESILSTTAFAEGTKGENVQDLTDAVQSVINSKDGQVWGYSTVYLEGERALVRGQETNLGNLTADANLAYAKSIDPSVVLSLKNGGGIRSQIGAIDVLTGEKKPTAANPSAGKAEGGISTLDIENSLRFNNGLSLVTVTASKLRELLEHGVASFPNQGRFPQVSGVAFSFDPTRPAGNRIVNMTIEDATGKDLDLIVRNGTLHGDPNRTFRLVTLDFLANGGDGYLFPTGPGASRVNLFDPSAPATGVATFAANGKEQDVLAEYLASSHGSQASAFHKADTSAVLDLRLQNLTQRADSVVDPATISLSALSADKAEGSIGSTPITFTINRAGDPSIAVSVSWAVGGSGPNAADALDFAGSAFPSGIATLAAGQISQLITLNVVGDRSFEADEAFTLSLSNPVGGTLVASAASASGRIQNDDLPSPPAYTFSKSAEVVDEGSTLAIGVATANVSPGSPLYWRFSGVGITAADFTDGLLEGSTLLGIDGRAAFSKAIATDPDSNPNETLELRFFRDSARTQQIGSTVSVLLRQPSVGLVTDASDILTGTSADETLRGVPTGSTLRGKGSLDRLTGGGGNDQFVLGDAIGRFYDDGTPGLGSADLALITDFTSDDRIQLHGLATDYRLISGRYAGVSGIRIDALSPTPEAIGFVQGSTLASLSLADPSQFVFV
jgi:2',3'-cyclic-nucleotide 2'-phosphodiesterase (5'-nucleotidase family)